MSVQQLPLYTVDAFTDVPFAGNPAAVCLDQTELGLSADLMQKIAAEMNISETAFIKPPAPGDGFDTGSIFGLRWFTPTSEVPLCGHATLASAAVLFFCRANQSQAITFKTASGDLKVQRASETSIGMDLPLNKPEKLDQDDVKDLLKVVVGDLPIAEVYYSATTKKLLLRLHDDIQRDQLEDLKPDIASFTSQQTKPHVKGVIVTLKGNSETKSQKGEQYDFLSRYFAPWVGIPEDPVTGSAHTVLAGYWSETLEKNTFFARQCSPRGGDMLIGVEPESDRVKILGQATIVVRGEISIPSLT